MIERLNGRMAVIPISGGQDSKTIITVMKRLGYPKIKAFSYGKKDSLDVINGKKVSEQLGVPWKHIAWNGKFFKDLLDDTDFVETFHYSARGCRSYMALTYLAYRELLDSGFIDKDSVIISGSALDFLAGGHIPDPGRGNSTRDELAKYIYERHVLRKNGSKKIIKHLVEHMNLTGEVIDFNEWCRIICQWEFDNRQSKFIANEKRAAEFVGIGFEMPFWDDRVVSFFTELPIGMLYNRTLQTEYSINYIDKEIGLAITQPVSPTVNNQNNNMRKILKRYLPFIIDMYHVMKQYKTYDSDANGYLDYQSKGRYLINLLKHGSGYNLNSEFSMKYIEWEKKQQANYG